MRLRALVAGTFLMCSALVACGSSSEDVADTGPARGSTDVSALQAVMDEYTAVPEFEPPGPAVDASEVAGKTVFNIPDSSGNPFAAAVAESEAKAAELLGIEFINCENQGQVSQWVACYNQAVQRKVDVINDFGGADPRQLGPQIEAAQKAGIEVVGHNVYGFSQKPVGLKYSVPTPYEKAGELMGTWVALDTERDANVLVIRSNEVLATEPIVENFKAVFDEECPDCKITEVNVPVKDWGTKIQSEVQSAIVRDPELDYVIPIYDSMTQFVVPAITAAGKIGDVHVATFNGTPFVLKYMQEGDIVRMVVGESLDWIGYAFMDSDARLLAGMGLDEVFDAKIPLRVFTKDNVDEAGSPPAVSTGYGDSYIEGYTTLWGLE